MKNLAQHPVSTSTSKRAHSAFSIPAREEGGEGAGLTPGGARDQRERGAEPRVDEVRFDAISFYFAAIFAEADAIRAARLAARAADEADEAEAADEPEVARAAAARAARLAARVEVAVARAEAARAEADAARAALARAEAAVARGAR